MIWHGKLDLPSELEGKLPRLATEVIVSLAGIAVAVGFRMTLQLALGDIVPFALTFPVLLAVVLLAGGRAGLMTLVGCQLLIWYHVLPVTRSFAIADLTTLGNLVLVTLAQLVLLWAVTSYRDAVRLSMAASDSRIESLSLALREIDHRTRNNFQLAIALLTLQARGSGNAEVQAGLEKAAARLQAIASIYSNLALSSASLDQIRLHDHLHLICNHLREGLLPASVDLDHQCDPMLVSQDVALRVGLIVNELVTNAAKHAFPDAIGTIKVRLCSSAGEGGGMKAEVVVCDDGIGLPTPTGTQRGLGGSLVEMLCRQLGTRLEATNRDGAHFRFEIPIVARLSD